ncbi:MAG: Holliday junction ATP-dependent DNA helicase RuvA [Herpetosiphonaceae bacterium]|nr:MAG: Holliday junction ATP-dependent DNA helicase RuvA [Herpetosiphonaceae bacterium]
MIALLRGRLSAYGPDYVIIETGGVGFLVYAPRRVVDGLGPAGSEVLLHTYLHVREDALVLYGFATPDQKALFELLLSVTGVGPRVALNLLSAVAPEELRGAIVREDVALLARVPGIGKKTAARLVLELKAKLAAAGVVPAGQPLSPGTLALNTELVDVLTGLGYSVAEAQSAVAALPPDAPADLEERLRLALQYFGGV